MNQGPIKKGSTKVLKHYYKIKFNTIKKIPMKTQITFLALLFITTILMLLSFATANIYLLLFAEIFFFVSGSIVLFINYKKN